MSFFSAVIGPVAVAALFRFCSLIPTIGTPELVWKVGGRAGRPDLLLAA